MFSRDLSWATKISRHLLKYFSTPYTGIIILKIHSISINPSLPTILSFQPHVSDAGSTQVVFPSEFHNVYANTTYGTLG